MKKIIILTLTVLLSTIPLFSQISSRNGYRITGHDTIRVFFVFAELLNDPNYDDLISNNWKAGEMPTNADSYYEHEIDEIIEAYQTKYYHQASFGDFVVLGDYYPNLVQIDTADIQGDGSNNVFSFLNSLPGNDFTTANGYSFKNDFDNWTSQGLGEPIIKNKNNKIDVFMIIWRCNYKYSPQNLSGAGYSYYYQSFDIKGKIGCDLFMFFKLFQSDPTIGIKHELGHGIIGDNRFHTGGSCNGSDWTFLSAPNSNSILSYNAAFSKLYSAFERRRIGWKPQNSNFYIKAINPVNNNEIFADIQYGQNLQANSNEYILRDFVTTGDAIRIKLPYLKSDSIEVNNQWIWLENHQMKNGNIDHAGNVQPKGIYAYIQVGKEDTTSFEGNANYTWFMHPFGNYDVEYSNMRISETIDTTESDIYELKEYLSTKNTANIMIDTINRQNPFTGYGMNILMAFDIIDQDSLDKIYGKEYIYPKGIIVNGRELPNEYFDYQNYATFGTIYDAYQVGDKINISTNPASTPLMTYRHESNENYFYDKPTNYDNRKIYLNGLSIEIIEQYTNGDIKVRVTFDNYNVDNNSRWCGDIILNEEVNLQPNKTIKLDQGLMPTRSSDPIIFNNKKIFTSPTVFTCNENSYFTQQPNSKVEVKNGSSLVLKSGSTYEIFDNAELSIKDNSIFKMEPCSKLIIHGTGNINFDVFAQLQISDGAILVLDDVNQNIIIDLSKVVIPEGYINPFEYLVPKYKITSVQNWKNNDYYVTDTIIIKQNGVLILDTINLKFAPNTKLVVKPGGKLIINGGKLTNSCDKFWEGITVLGNSELSQSNISNQGYLEINNGAIIEHSKKAIFVGDPQVPYGNKNGGIIKINNAIFRDNISSIEIPKYQYFMFDLPNFIKPNVSEIKNSIFETTDYLKIKGKSPNASILLWEVYSVYIHNNTFVNNNPEIYGRDKGIGIRTWSAKYTSKDNVFRNLTQGIYSSGTGSMTNFTIDNCNFIGNTCAIQMEGQRNATITRNTINCEGSQSPYIVGVMVKNCIDFNIAENTIIKPNISISPENSGIFLNNNMRSNNSIYKNKFTNLKYGIISINNPQLTFECNEFSGNENYGIYIADDIMWNQGSSTHPVANKFFTTCNNYDIYSKNNVVSYFYHNKNEYIPKLINTDKIILFSVPNNNINECPSQFENVNPWPIASYVSLNNSINNKEEELQLIIDGGSTENTINEITSSTYNEALELRDNLLEKSPNLSDTAMITSVKAENILPEIMLAEVLTANSQAAKSKNVMLAIDNRTNQLSNYLKDEINLGLYSISEKEQLELDINLLKMKRAYIYQHKVSNLLSDTSINSHDSLIQLFQITNDLHSKYSLVSYNIRQKKYNNAKNVLLSIKTDIDLTNEQMIEYNKMTTFYNIFINLLETNKSFYEMDSIQLQQMYLLSEDTTSQAGTYAKGVISLLERNNNEIIFPIPANNSMCYSNNPEQTQFVFNLTPNPANDFFIVEYALETNNFVRAKFTMYNYEKAQIYEQFLEKRAYQLIIQTENIDPGTYICKLEVDGKIFGEKSITIKAEQMTDEEIANSKNTENLSNKHFINYFNVYPNPANAFVIVDYSFFENNNKNAEIQITNNNGDIIKSEIISHNTGRKKIITSDLLPGTYVINILIFNKVIESQTIVVK